MGLNETQLVRAQNCQKMFDTARPFSTNLEVPTPLWTKVIVFCRGSWLLGGKFMKFMKKELHILPEGIYFASWQKRVLSSLCVGRFIETMVNTTGHRVSERAIQLGHMFDTDSALKAGLVDKVVDEADVIAAAEREIATWQKIPGEHVMFVLVCFFRWPWKGTNYRCSGNEVRVSSFSLWKPKRDSSVPQTVRPVCGVTVWRFNGIGKPAVRPLCWPSVLCCFQPFQES